LHRKLLQHYLGNAFLPSPFALMGSRAIMVSSL
jgi:hypothetical protein